VPAAVTLTLERPDVLEVVGSFELGFPQQPLFVPVQLAFVCQG
jgi:hypothetical protein